MPKVQHAVFLKLRSDLSQADIDGLFQAIADLQNLIPGVESYAGGPNCSPEGLAKGFTHGFVMTFASEAARDGYLPHPAHKAVVNHILGMLDGGLDGAHVLDWLLPQS